MAESYMDLNPGEEIVQIYHRHIINYIPIIVATVLVLIATAFAQAQLTAHVDLFTTISAPAITTLLMIVDLLVLLIAVVAYYIFHQNRVILTNQHLIQITQSGLFGRQLAKFSLDELQDVQGSRSGVFATIFNYGQILIETAGERENFLFRPVGNPLSVAETINDAHETFERAHTFIHP